jgi:GNAT superfamily N-acetyltransferase
VKSKGIVDQQVIEQPASLDSAAYLTLKCAVCYAVLSTTVGNYRRRKRRRPGQWVCNKCLKPILAAESRANPIYKDPTYCKKFANLHDDPDYAAKVHNNNIKRKIAYSQRRSWENCSASERERRLHWRRSDKGKTNISNTSKKAWADKDYAKRQHELRSESKYYAAASKRSKELWQSPEYRNKMINVLDKARLSSWHTNKVSSLQTTLYSILDDLKVPYFAEGAQTTVGPIVTTNSRFTGYIFDCKIPKHGSMQKNLMIECQGYWHYTKNKQANDNAKATFLKTYFGEDYDLLAIWDYEFRSRQLVENIIREKLGLNKPYEIIDFNFSDIIFECADVTDELRSLFAKYHYMANIGRFGSVRYVAKLNNKIIASAVFSHPTREQSAKRLNVLSKHALELTRFVIHPQYQKKNLASMLLGKAIRFIKGNKPLVKVIYTFADTTYAHEGTIYRAAGWKFDGFVKPDYWYVDANNAWYHKKTVWDHAARLKLDENQYAIKYGMHKVLGKEKLRYVRWLQK